MPAQRGEEKLCEKMSGQPFYKRVMSFLQLPARMGSIVIDLRLFAPYQTSIRYSEYSRRARAARVY